MPTAPEDANPFEGQGANDDLVGHVLRAAAVIEGLGPEGMGNALSDPFDEGLAEEGRANETPVGPRLVAAALDDGSDTRALLHGGGIGEAVSVLAEGREESGRERGASAGQRREYSVIRQLGGPGVNLGIETGDGLGQDADLREERLCQEPIRLDDGSVGGELTRGFDGVDPTLDEPGGADIVRLEKLDQGLEVSPLGGGQGRPASDEVDEDVGVLVAEPADDLWEVLFEGVGQAIDEPAAVIDEVATVLNQALESAHGGPFAAQWGQAVEVMTEQVEGEEGILGVVLRSTGRECSTVLREHGWVDGEDDEEVVLEEGGDDGTAGELDADGDGPSTEAVLSLAAQASMATGSCSSTANSGVSWPVSSRQMSCLRSAQSRPMTAAKSEGWLGMWHLG